MTQYDIYQFLKFRSNELFTSEELTRHLKINRGQVTQGLRRLRKIFPIVKLLRDNQRSIYYAYSEDLNNHMKDRKQAQNQTNGTTMKRIKDGLCKY